MIKHSSVSWIGHCATWPHVRADTPTTAAGSHERYAVMLVEVIAQYVRAADQGDFARYHYFLISWFQVRLLAGVLLYFNRLRRYFGPLI